MHLPVVLKTLFVTLLLSTVVQLTSAAPAPSPPDSTTVWNSGDTVTISWTENSSPPSTSSLSAITISLMTGSDLSQIYLGVIASNLSDTTTSVKWTVPSLSTYGYPAGKIYFIMFSDSKTPTAGVSWSTRFTILDGNTPTASYDSSGGPFTIKPNAPGSPTPTANASTTSDTTSTTSTTSSSSPPVSTVTVTPTDDGSGSAPPTQTGPLIPGTGVGVALRPFSFGVAFVAVLVSISIAKLM